MRNEIVIGNIYELLADALEMSAKKLRTPSKTKLDENGLAPCGCGGRPTFHHAYIAKGDKCYFECTACGARGALRLGEERARYSWNTAMGWKE